MNPKNVLLVTEDNEVLQKVDSLISGSISNAVLKTISRPCLSSDLIFNLESSTKESTYPQLILVDQISANDHFFYLLNLIRFESTFFYLPVILLLDNDNSVHLNRFEEFGIVDYVYKDKLERLVFCLKRELSNYQHRMELKKLSQLIRDKNKQNRDIYQIISEYTEDIVVIADFSGAIEYVSPSLSRVLGYDKKDFNNLKDVIQVLHPEDRQAVQDSYNNAILSRSEGQNFLSRMLHTVGEYVWLENKIRFYYEDSKLIRIVLVSKEIEFRKNLQEQLLKNAEEATIKSEKAVQSKITLLSIIAHEMRIQLNNISGILYLLLSNSSDSNEKRILEVLNFSSDNLKLFMDDISDLASIESGMFKINKIEFHLKEILYKVYQSHYISAREKGINFNIQLSDYFPEKVVGDHIRLIQLLNNLLNNAMKYTEKGNVLLKAELLEETESFYSFSFLVKDSGIGIDREKQEAIVNFFQNIDRESINKYGVSGFGLSIVKEITNLLGGSLIINSKPGEGSEFTIRLKFHKARRENAHLLDVDPHAFTPMNKMKILYIEDSYSSQVFMSELLKMWNIDLTLSYNGYEALELLKKEKFDLILIDIQLTGMDGFEIAQQIRRLPNSEMKSIPLIAVTGSLIDSNFMVNLKYNKINDVVTKPINPELIYSKLKNFHDMMLGESLLPITVDISLDFSSIEEVYSGSIEDYKFFLNKIVEEFQKYKFTFDNFLKAGDLENFRKNKHKISATLRMLKAESFLSYLEEVKLRFDELAPREETITKIRRYIDVITDKIQLETELKK